MLPLHRLDKAMGSSTTTGQIIHQMAKILTLKRANQIMMKNFSELFIAFVNIKMKFFKICFLVICIIHHPSLIAQESLSQWAEHEVLRIHAPDLSQLGRQQDAYVIEIKDSKTKTIRTVMIDTGFYEEMKDYGVDYLKGKGIHKIDELYITHAHKDHYGGLQALIEKRIPIGTLYFNYPLKSTCDKELKGGCDYEHVLYTIELAKKSGINHKEIYINDPKNPAILWRDGNYSLELLFASQGTHPELGEVYINDQSMVMKLNTPHLTYLFTGDLGPKAGEYLLSQIRDRLKSDILKIPHHGAEFTVSNEFIDAVQPIYALVPTYRELWCGERSSRVRNLLKDKNIDSFIMEFSRAIEIIHFENHGPIWTTHPLAERNDCNVLYSHKRLPSPELKIGNSINLKLSDGAIRTASKGVKLETIGVLFATYQRTNSGTARLSLEEISGKIWETTIELSELQDNIFKYFNVPPGLYVSGHITGIDGFGISTWESHGGDGSLKTCLKYRFTDKTQGFTIGCPNFTPN